MCFAVRYAFVTMNGFGSQAERPHVDETAGHTGSGRFVNFPGGRLAAPGLWVLLRPRQRLSVSGIHSSRERRNASYLVYIFTFTSSDI